MVITEYNAPNEIAFLQSNLGFYKVMSFDTTSIKTSNDRDEKFKVPIPRGKIMMQFIDSIVANLQCLGEEADPVSYFS